jgi:hypothetical protein
LGLVRVDRDEHNPAVRVHEFALRKSDLTHTAEPDGTKRRIDVRHKRRVDVRHKRRVDVRQRKPSQREQTYHDTRSIGRVHYGSSRNRAHAARVNTDSVSTAQMLR